MKDKLTTYEYKKLNNLNRTIVYSFNCKNCSKNFIIPQSSLNMILNFKYCPCCGKQIKEFIKIEGN